MKTRLAYFLCLLLYIFLSINALAPNPSAQNLGQRQARFRLLVARTLDTSAPKMQRADDLKELKAMVTKDNYTDYRGIINRSRARYIKLLEPTNELGSSAFVASYLDTFYGWYKVSPQEYLQESIILKCINNRLLFRLMDADEACKTAVKVLYILKNAIRDQRLHWRTKKKHRSLIKGLIDQQVFFSLAQNFSKGEAQEGVLQMLELILQTQEFEEDTKKEVRAQIGELISRQTLKTIIKASNSGHARMQAMITMTRIVEDKKYEGPIIQKVREQLRDLVFDRNLIDIVRDFKSGHLQMQALMTFSRILEDKGASPGVKKEVRSQLRELVFDETKTLKRIAETFKNGMAQMRALVTLNEILEDKEADDDVKMEVRKQIEELVYEKNKKTLKKIVKEASNGMAKMQALITMNSILEDKGASPEVKQEVRKQLGELVLDKTLKNIVKGAKNGMALRHALMTLNQILEDKEADDKVKKEVRKQLKELVFDKTLKNIVEKSRNANAQMQALITYDQILADKNAPEDLKKEVRKQIKELVFDKTLKKMVERFDKKGNAQKQALITLNKILEDKGAEDRVKQEVRRQIGKLVYDKTLWRIVKKATSGDTQAQALVSYVKILEDEGADPELKKEVRKQIRGLVVDNTLIKFIKDFSNVERQRNSIITLMKILDDKEASRDLKQRVRKQIEQVIFDKTIKTIVKESSWGKGQMQALLLMNQILEDKEASPEVKEEVRTQLGKLVFDKTLKRIVKESTSGSAKRQSLVNLNQILEDDEASEKVQKEVRKQLGELVFDKTLKEIAQSDPNGIAQQQALISMNNILEDEKASPKVKSEVRTQLGELIFDKTFENIIRKSGNGEAQAQILITMSQILADKEADDGVKQEVRRLLRDLVVDQILKDMIMDTNNRTAQRRALISSTEILEDKKIEEPIKLELVKQLSELILDQTFKKLTIESSIIKNIRAGLRFYESLLEKGETWGFKEEVINRVKEHAEVLARDHKIQESDHKTILEKLIRKFRLERVKKGRSQPRRSGERANSVVIPMPEAWIEGDMGRMKRDVVRGANFVGTSALGGLSFTIGEYGSELILSKGDWSKLSHIALGDVVKSYGALTVGSGTGNATLNVAGNTIMLTEAGKRFAASAKGQLVKGAAKKFVPLYFALLALELIREGEISPLPQQALAMANILLATGSVHAILKLGRTLYYARKGVNVAKLLNLPSVTPQTIAINGLKMAAVSILDFTAIKGLAMGEEKIVMMAVEHNLKVQVADACTYMDKLIKKFEDDPNSVTVGDLLYAKEVVRDSFLMLAQFRNPQVFEAIKLKVAVENGKISEDEVDEEIQKVYESAEYLPESQRYTPFVFPILDVMYRGDLGEIEIPEPSMNTDGTSVFLSNLSTVHDGMPDFGETIDEVVEREPRYFMNIYNNVSEDPLGVIQQYEEFMGTRMWVLEQFATLVTREVLADTGS